MVPDLRKRIQDARKKLGEQISVWFLFLQYLRCLLTFCRRLPKMKLMTRSLRKQTTCIRARKLTFEICSLALIKWVMSRDISPQQEYNFQISMTQKNHNINLSSV
jgi:hypothetical protein